TTGAAERGDVTVDDSPRLGRRTSLAGAVSQLAERLGLDLADAFAGDGEVLTDLLEGVVGGLADAEAHAEDLLFAGGERGQDTTCLIGQVHVDHRVGRRSEE